ncbi:restriction endonuclease subunit S [Vibrio parahaemolyticus]|uniref:restriction endonuclease subunit S n=1 Tax=Vibrio parahaemolyticus TaxID=670 RepID=UPI00111FB58C|nr:restriction endonuclease subunit S [Vibrio parahaemolyticus]TOD66158.1 restriction endonuclease subunit S [Vibrio parahaemolyticus]
MILKDVPGWQYPALGDICDVRDGTHDSPKYVEDGFPLITSKNLTEDGLCFEKVNYITREDHDAIEKRSAVSDGDILYGMIGTVGNPVIVKKDRDFSVKNVAIFKFLEESLIFNKYLFYVLSSDFVARQISKESKGGTQKFVSLKVLRGLKIPLPPLETQKKIAAVLEKTDQLRKDCKLLEQELNSLAQSVFIDMFGDVRSNSFNSKKVKFDDIFEINSKLVDPRLPEFENLPHIGPEHLEKRTGRILPYRTAREDALVSGKFNFQKGCVLFSKIRPNLKKVAIPEFSGLCSADMYPLEAVDGVSTREFIWGLILSDAFDDYLETLPSRANIPKINRKELAAFEFYLPDLRDQKAYSKKLAKIQEQLKQNACLYQETENNFNALMQKAFKGKLTL